MQKTLWFACVSTNNKYNSQLSNHSPIKFDYVESVSKDRQDNGTRMKYSLQIISGASANFASPDFGV